MAELNEEEALINIVKIYIENYLSSEYVEQFINAYNNSRYDETNKILIKTIEKIIEHSTLELSTNDVFSHIFDKYIKTSKMKRGRKKMINAMLSSQSSQSDTLLLICVCIAVILIIVCGYLYVNKNRNINLIKKPQEKNRRQRKVEQQFTQNDKDMLKLIQELAEVYQKTDNYLNS